MMYKKGDKVVYVGKRLPKNTVLTVKKYEYNHFYSGGGWIAVDEFPMTRIAIASVEPLNMSIENE